MNSVKSKIRRIMINKEYVDYVLGIANQEIRQIRTYIIWQQSETLDEITQKNTVTYRHEEIDLN